MNKKRLNVWLPTIFILTIVLIVASNPLRRSEAHIRAELLSAMPLGSPLESVEQYIVREGWEVVWISKTHGFNHQDLSPSREVGTKSIRSNLGDYQDIPFAANVTVFWGFNDQSKLIDIWVWKTWDAP